MKAIKYVSMVAIAFAMVACSNDGNEVMDNWNGEIRLSSGVSIQTRANSDDVPDKQIAENELIGIYVSGVDGETAYNGYGNVSAKADGNGNFSAYSTTMYYPQSGNGVKISAYHPYNAGTEVIEYDFVVEGDQSVAGNYYKSDLLYSEVATIERSKTAHNLTFKHKLAKITCSLTAGDGVSTVEGATVEVVNPEKAVKFNRTTGVVGTATTSAKGNVTLETTYGAIIAPQTISSGSQLLKVTLSATAGGGVFYYTTTEQTQFVSGNLYHYEITVKATGLTVASEISPWENIESNNKTGDAIM